MRDSTLSSLDFSEQEILKAKAEALGRAGEKLAGAVARYRAAKARDPESVVTERAWADVVQAREVLIVLREGIGIRRHEAIDEEYELPFCDRS